MDIDKMTLRVQKALSDANVIAVKYNHQQIEVIHLFAALMEQEDGLIPNILNKMGINNKEVTAKIDAKLSSMPKVLGEGANSSGVYITRQVNEVLVKAEEISKKFQFEEDDFSERFPELSVLCSTSSAGTFIQQMFEYLLRVEYWSKVLALSVIKVNKESLLDYN